MKGLPVVSCGYRDPDISVQQVKDMIKFRAQTPDETRDNLQGYVHTIWSSAGRFLRSYFRAPGQEDPRGGRPDGSVEAAKAVLKYFKELQ